MRARLDRGAFPAGPARRGATSCSGFSMLEMLVAVTATVILVLFLNQIFTSMSGGVSAGVATSDILQNNAVFSRQIGADSAAMTGPEQLGFLVIVQREVNSTEFSDLRLRKDDARPAAARPVRVRSDQLVWIRERRELQPRTPAAENAFTDAQSTAPYVRVWYGHVLRTDPDGTLPVAGLTAGDLGRAPNQYASQWILGRQALFLGGGIGPITVDSFTAGYDSDDWEVNGYSGMPAGLTPTRWNMALSDIFDRDLAGLTGLAGAITTTGYPNGAYRLTYGYRPLWCNPDPATAVTQAPAWQVAQMHPHLIANVSQFQVDFAGDYMAIDPNTGLPNPASPADGIVDLVDGQIAWYSVFYNLPPSPGFPAGRRIVWDPVQLELDEVAYDPLEPVTYPPPEWTLTSFPDGFVDPNDLASGSALNGIIHHMNTGGANPFPMRGPQAAFTWGPAAAPGGAHWPHMIRIRYRVHDKNGRLSDADGRLGKLFERVIRVRDLLGAFDPG